MALAAVAFPINWVAPPPKRLIGVPLGKFVIVAVPALAESKNNVSPPPDAESTARPLLIKLAPFALEVSRKLITPPEVEVPPLVVKLVWAPVVALLVKLS